MRRRGKSDSALGQLRKLGPRLRAMLVNAAITSADQLRAMGAARAFVAVRRAGGAPSWNLLWAIQGVLAERDWKQIARSERLALLTQVESLAATDAPPATSSSPPLNGQARRAGSS